MENKLIKISDLITFIDKIKDDEYWVGDDYECYNVAYQYLNWIREQLNSCDLDYKMNRDDLDSKLDSLVDDYDFYLCDLDLENGIGLESWELDDLRELNKKIAQEILPMWIDTANRYVNLGYLIKRYDLDIDELYYDEDNKCIRDKNGNIWWE